ncbi:hypothetical protein OHE73_21900, partial [Escherichia coli]|nr:hypothetical protein [Escherichia coli]
MHENTVASPRKGEIIICMTRPVLSHEHSVSVSSFRHEAFRLPGLYIARKAMHIVGIIQRIRQKDPTMGCDYAIWL